MDKPCLSARLQWLTPLKERRVGIKVTTAAQVKSVTYIEMEKRSGYITSKNIYHI